MPPILWKLGVGVQWVSRGWIPGFLLKLDPLSSPVTVADYISRAKSQSRQRPPLDRTKPSEDSLSGQKVGKEDIVYPTTFCVARE